MTLTFFYLRHVEKPALALGSILGQMMNESGDRMKMGTGPIYAENDAVGAN
jgi:hypothetical protein